jgi:segregation and condensation protein B
MRTSRIVEALLFASHTPLSAAELARADAGLDEEQVERAVAELRHEYAREQRAFDIVEIAGGYQLLTRPEYAAVLERFDAVPHPTRLSNPALETLAIVAYRQPVTRGTIEAIRGVSSDASLATLKARGLVAEAGRADTPGRPVLWITTQRFLQHFGLERPADLPALPEDLELPEDDAGVQLALDAEPAREPARDEAEVAADLAALSHAAETALAAHRREADASSGAEPPSE